MSTGMKAVNLRCEYLVDPVAVDVACPALSWEVVGAGCGESIASCRIEAASSLQKLERGEADLWASDGNAAGQRREYAGRALPAFSRCFWRVRVGDGAWSAPASFGIGMLGNENWRGGWISYYAEGVHNGRQFRKDFSAVKPLARAMLYASARGIYQAEINGRPVGHDVFAPGWTDYHKRIYYNAYDVTALMNEGENAIGIALGEGWFKGTTGFSEKRNVYGFRTEILANLRLEYADGTVEVVATDESWTSRLGPVQQGGFLQGENYDARLEQAGWSRPGGGRGWTPVRYFPLEGKEYWDNGAWAMMTQRANLSAYPTEPVRRTQELPALESWQSLPGSRIYDFGQNFAGRVRLRIRGRAGQMLRLRFGEMVNPDRTLYSENMRSADCTDTYICRGGGEECWEPEWTFHGFRYAELTGLEEGQEAETTGVVLGSDTRPVGRFSCSDPMINQLYSNIVWTQRANFLEVPTDCPQRDERLGWTGDAQVFIRTATYNMDVAAFFRKWLVDLEDTQNAEGAVANVAPRSFLTGEADAAWGDAAVICPWWIYRVYGDTEVLRKHYGMMRNWLKYLQKTSRNDLRGTWTFCFGDWLSVNESTPNEVVQTAMFAYVADLMRQVAGVIGQKADEEEYRLLRERIGAAFLREFVDAEGVVRGNTQTAYVLALKFGLLPEGVRQKAAQKLVANLEAQGVHLTTGFVGTPYLLHVLSEIGRDDLAYQLLFNDTYPSWGYSIRNGATTIWERWNGWKKEEGCGDANMNSFSHYAYGSVGEWLFAKVAGIDLIEPGYRKFRIAPHLSRRLDWVKAEHCCMYGKIVSEWAHDGRGLTVKVAIPAGTTAEIVLPVAGGITVNNRPLAECATVMRQPDRNGEMVLQALCGEYLLRVE